MIALTNLRSRRRSYGVAPPESPHTEVLRKRVCVVPDRRPSGSTRTGVKREKSILFDEWCRATETSPMHSTEFWTPDHEGAGDREGAQPPWRAHH